MEWLTLASGFIENEGIVLKLNRILRIPELMLGLFIILFFASVALFAPILAPPENDDPYLMPQDGFVGSPEPPSPGHPLGLQEDKYDTLYGLIWGTRVAFRVGLVITLGRTLIGVVLGLISGYYGGRIDAVVMRITDAFLAFPIIAAVMVLLTTTVGYIGILIGAGDRAIIIALIFFGWMQYCRLMRGNVLVERVKEYVSAARSIGVPERRILIRHVLPNASRGLLVLIASDIGAMVVIVASLTFIGLAGNEATADWGMMLKQARNWVIGTPNTALKYWYTYVPPIISIVIFSIGWNLVGDGLRVFYDPRMRGVRG